MDDQYGTEADLARDQLRSSIALAIHRIWAKNKDEAEGLSAEVSSTDIETVGDTLRRLTPQDESHRILKAEALRDYGEAMKLRWTLIQQGHASIPTAFLVVLIFWFTVLFAVFTMLSPNNLTVDLVILFCSLSVAGGDSLDSGYEPTVRGIR